MSKISKKFKGLLLAALVTAIAVFAASGVFAASATPAKNWTELASQIAALNGNGEVTLAANFDAFTADVDPILIDVADGRHVTIMGGTINAAGYGVKALAGTSIDQGPNGLFIVGRNKAAGVTNNGTVTFKNMTIKNVGSRVDDDAALIEPIYIEVPSYWNGTVEIDTVTFSADIATKGTGDGANTSTFVHVLGFDARSERAGVEKAKTVKIINSKFHAKADEGYIGVLLQNLVGTTATDGNSKITVEGCTFNSVGTATKDRVAINIARTIEKANKDADNTVYKFSKNAIAGDVTAGVSIYNGAGTGKIENITMVGNNINNAKITTGRGVSATSSGDVTISAINNVVSASVKVKNTVTVGTFKINTKATSLDEAMERGFSVDLPEGVTVKKGATFDLDAPVRRDGDMTNEMLTLKWESTNPAIASLTDTDKRTVKIAGVADGKTNLKLTVTYNNGTPKIDGVSMDATCNVTVDASTAPGPVNKGAIEPKTPTGVKGAVAPSKVGAVLANGVLAINASDNAKITMSKYIAAFDKNDRGVELEAMVTAALKNTAALSHYVLAPDVPVAALPVFTAELSDGNNKIVAVTVSVDLVGIDVAKAKFVKLDADGKAVQFARVSPDKMVNRSFTIVDAQDKEVTSGTKNGICKVVVAIADGDSCDFNKDQLKVSDPGVVAVLTETTNPVIVHLTAKKYTDLAAVKALFPTEAGKATVATIPGGDIVMSEAYILAEMLLGKHNFNSYYQIPAFTSTEAASSDNYVTMSGVKVTGLNTDIKNWRMLTVDNGGNPHVLAYTNVPTPDSGHFFIEKVGDTYTIIYRVQDFVNGTLQTGTVYDIDPGFHKVGVVSTLIANSNRHNPSSSGCNAGLFAPLALLVLAPLAVRKIIKK